MKKHYLILLSALILITGCSTQSETPDHNTQTAIEMDEAFDINLQSEQGLRFLAEEKYPEAIDVFTEIIEFDETNTDAYIRRASAYIAENESTDNLTLALLDYEKACLLSQELTEAWLGVVDVHIRMNDFQKAMEIAEEGFEITGDFTIGDKLDKIRAGKISDTDNKVRRKTNYDADGVPIYYTDFWYRSDRRLEAATTFHPDGEQIEHLDYEYDDEGKVIKTILFNSTGGMNPVYLSYDMMGNISERITCRNTDGTVYLHDFCEYDGRGNMVKMVSYNGENKLLSTETFTFNEQNQMILRKEYDGPDEADSLITYRCIEYNQSGKRIKESYYWPDDTLYEYRVYLYDDAGLFLGNELYNGDHELLKSTTYE